MPYYMEDSLDRPLRAILQIMQDRIMNQSTYFGVKTLKSPNDYWIYQEIIWETKPDVIVEIGNYHGGSTLALAHLFDCIGKGRVIGVDISQEAIPECVRNHPRITLIEGNGISVFQNIANLIAKDERVLIIEDSSHEYHNTLNLLNLYSTLIKPGDYFIVEDSIVGHGLNFENNLGPFEAIEMFIKGNQDFEIDRTRESLLITWNPKGYLRRKEDKSQSLRVNSLNSLHITAEAWGEAVKRMMKLFIPPILLHGIRKLKRIF
jgi:cephalosporin hydroxylase